MAKNLIDDSTFEFVEGAEKTEHEALVERMTTAENDIDTAEGNITDLQTRMTAAEGNITDVDGALDTHEANTNVHLTPAEKAYIGEPFVCGNYTGTGGSSARTINLGFTPKVVYVCADNLPPAMISDPASSGGQNITYNFGSAMYSHHSFGVEITSGGFSVKNDIYNPGSTGSFNVVKLNESGTVYHYIALK